MVLVGSMKKGVGLLALTVVKAFGAVPKQRVSIKD